MDCSLLRKDTGVNMALISISAAPYVGALNVLQEAIRRWEMWRGKDELRKNPCFTGWVAHQLSTYIHGALRWCLFTEMENGVWTHNILFYNVHNSTCVAVNWTFVLLCRSHTPPLSSMALRVSRHSILQPVSLKFDVFYFKGEEI